MRYWITGWVHNQIGRLVDRYLRWSFGLTLDELRGDCTCGSDD